MISRCKDTNKRAQNQIKLDLFVLSSESARFTALHLQVKEFKTKSEGTKKQSFHKEALLFVMNKFLDYLFMNFLPFLITRPL